MTSRIAVVQIEGNYQASLNKALNLIGGIEDLNTERNDVVIKVGIFSLSSPQHSCSDLVSAIIDNFEKAPRIFLAESDNYRGKAIERLQIYKNLFTHRVFPLSLSDSKYAQELRIADENMNLCRLMFKPSIFVDTHILRTFPRGSILKNLFGCTPFVEKARFHRKEIFSRLLADIYEAIGGIDLAVVDGTHMFHSGTATNVLANTLIVGRDAVAVDAIAGKLAGLKAEKMDWLKEFARRGLGETDVDKIEILGSEVDRLDEEFSQYRKILRRQVKALPRVPGVANTVDKLIAEGWMDRPKSTVEVVDELKKRGTTNAQVPLVSQLLKRRVRAKKPKNRIEQLTENGEIVYRHPPN